MDPFSAGAAAVGLVTDVARVIEYLRAVKAALNTIDDDIDSLIRELESLKELYGDLKRESNRQQNHPSLDTSQQDLWASLGRTLKDAETALGKFEEDLRRVYGDHPNRQGWLDAFKKQHLLRERMPRLRGWRDSIRNYNTVIQAWLQRITLSNHDLAQQDSSAHLDAVLKCIKNTEAHLEDSEQTWHQHDRIFDAFAYQIFNKSSIAALEGLKASLASSEDKSINQHFDLPQALDSCYVGREEESQILALSFFPQTREAQHGQRRFVVYGVGGSGKTQFCCKFAQDYQQRFWGVFWVDARSHDQLRQTLSQNVASIGGVASNHIAALHWLSNHERWLLIYDNADDPLIELAEYFPKGGRGCILITTRNPGFQWLGNVGPRCLKFQEMREKEAYILLLSIVGHSESSSAELTPLAKKIVQTLGYLALAIAVAGKTIRAGVCKFQDYLKHFEKECLERIQFYGRSQTGQPVDYESNRFVSPLSHVPSMLILVRESRVEATFDISLKAIVKKGTRESKDALQLLKTFAFLHCENVRFDFLKHLVENARKEQEFEASNKMRTSLTPQTWRQYALELWIWVMTMPQRSSTSLILPDVLRQARATYSLDDGIGTRVRRAMQQLTQYSLTSWNEKTDSWSMHPLVHRWARESLGMRLGEQHVWCEAAATLLSSCIIIGQNDEVVMRYLLPHVDEVLSRQANLEKRTKDQRMARLYPWPIFESGFSPQRARMFAKFSIVYSQNGLFDKAVSLQSAVQSFAVNVLGFESPNTRQITVALAGTLSHLGRSDDSAKLLEVLLDNCTKVLGSDHRDSYVAKLRLAESRMHQGRVPDARRLCEDAKEGLTKLCGNEDEETLNAMDILAGVMVLSATPGAVAEAQDLNRETWRTRQRLLGAEHIKTLDSRQNFYTNSFWKGDRDEHLEAEKGMMEIIEIRRTRQGRENPWTLLAMLYLARIKVELQDFDAAEELFNEGLPIAERNLGKDHVAVLFCRYHIGRMRVRQKRWVEARDILVDVTERQKTTLHGWGRFHYDRMGGLLELARAHHELGEYDECDEVVVEADRGYTNITTKEHPWHRKLLSDHATWKLQRASVALQLDSEAARGAEQNSGPLKI